MGGGPSSGSAREGEGRSPSRVLARTGGPRYCRAMTTKHTALITGASGGLGKELAGLFAKDGHDVILVARTEAKLQAVQAELEKAHGVKAHVIAADLTDAAAPARLFHE